MSGAAGGAGAGPALPLAALGALATSGFLAIMTETMPAGLLGPIAHGLGTTASGAGQWVTAYAAGSLVAAVPLVRATLAWRRRGVLLLAVAGLAAMNGVAAVSASFALTLAARFLAGVAAGLVWGLVGGIARRLVAPVRHGQALAIAMAGTPVALAIGVPVGTFGGDALGWRATFGCMSVLGCALLAWIRLALPELAGSAGTDGGGVLAVAVRPGVLPVMAVIVAWMFGHNVLYTYVAPFVGRAGLGDAVGSVLVLFGIAALAGLWAVGRWVDRHLRACALGCLALFTVAGAALFAFGRSEPVVLAGIGVWGLTFGGASPLLNTAIADAAGAGADLALAMVTTVWNLAIAAGGIAGGVLLARCGPASLALVASGSALAGLAIVAGSARHGFTAGVRRS